MGGPDYVNVSFAGCINLRLSTSTSATFTAERRPTAKSTRVADSSSSRRKMTHDSLMPFFFYIPSLISAR